MFKDNSVIAIDIGSKFIKIVEGKQKNNGVKITNYGICDTPKGTFIEGNINDRRDIYKAIYDLMNSKNFKSKNVIMGVKGQDIIIRHIEMPSMSDKQLNQAVKLEIQQYLPMDPGEYVIDSKNVGKVEGKQKMLNVLMVAAPKKKIEDYFYIANKLELKVKAIDLFANSVTKLLQNNTKKGNTSNVSCIGMVDLGYESSTVTLVENGRLFLEREINIGIKNIDSMLANVFAASLEKIDSIRSEIVSINSYEKGTNNDDDPRIYYANNNARLIIDKLIDHILKVVDFYVSSGFNKSVDCLYIYGGGSKLNGMTEYIKNSVNINTMIFDEFLLSNVYNINDSLKRDMELYINCISLLLRRE